MVRTYLGAVASVSPADAGKQEARGNRRASQLSPSLPRVQMIDLKWLQPTNGKEIPIYSLQKNLPMGSLTLYFSLKLFNSVLPALSREALLSTLGSEHGASAPGRAAVRPHVACSCECRLVVPPSNVSQMPQEKGHFDVMHSFSLSFFIFAMSLELVFIWASQSFCGKRRGSSGLEWLMETYLFMPQDGGSVSSEARK